MAPKNFFIDLFLYEMIKCQLNITLYEKISLHSIRFDISLSQACCPGITEMPFKVTEMPNRKMQCPGIRCVILYVLYKILYKLVMK